METTDIKKGTFMTIDNVPYIVTDFQFVSPGKGSAFTRTKLKNLFTGAVIDRTFKSREKVEGADVDEKIMEFIYNDNDEYFFMDPENYEQISIDKAKISEETGYLQENAQCRVLFYNDDAISITLPMFVEIEIKETGPSNKGNTVTSSYKPADLITGATVQVPMFVKTGETIKIDTRDRSYVERVK